MQLNMLARRTRALVAIGFLCSLSQVPSIGAVSFDQGVRDYLAGKYALALSELQPYETAYPNNACAHYYIALCHQGLNHLNQAKTEYSWVIEHGDAKLKGMAQVGFDRLANAHTSGSYSSAAAPARASASQPAAQTKPVVAAKIKKVIEFYADW